MCLRVRFLQESLEEPLVKLRKQSLNYNGDQDTRVTRTMDVNQGKLQPEREELCPAGGRPTEAELPEMVGAQKIPSQGPRARHGTAGCGSLLPFEMGMFTPCL